MVFTACVCYGHSCGQGVEAGTSRQSLFGSLFMRITCRLFAFCLVAIVAWGNAPARADFLYVARGDNRINRIDTTTQVETTFAITAASSNNGLAFDSTGILYASSTAAGAISRFTSSGVGSVFGPALDTPEGLAFDSAGSLYVAQITSNVITKITPGGVGSTFSSTGSGPADLAFDSAGNLFVSADFGNTIQRITPGGVVSTFATAGLQSPTGLAFDFLGNLYVANLGNNTIQRFTPGGVGSVFASGGLLNGPEGLAFDSAGNLYVSNSGDGVITRFTPGGVGTLFATESLAGLRFLAIQPSTVPEPSTMLLLSIGGLILFARIHSRVAN